MKLTGALLAATAVTLVLAGCGNTADPPTTSLPTPGDVFGGPVDTAPSLAGALETTPAVPPPSPGSDVRFLTLLNVRGVPYTGSNPAADASITCANLATGAHTWDEVVSLSQFPEVEQRRWWTLTAVEVYCPELG